MSAQEFRNMPTFEEAIQRLEDYLSLAKHQIGATRVREIERYLALIDRTHKQEIEARRHAIKRLLFKIENIQQ
jgi:hypothetical protein